VSENEFACGLKWGAGDEGWRECNTMSLKMLHDTYLEVQGEVVVMVEVMVAVVVQEAVASLEETVVKEVSGKAVL
jgi:hypothetical protein